MLFRELKVNFKSFIIWVVALCLMFGVVFLVYPSIASSDNMKMLDEMMKIFPKEILVAFNMDISSIETAFGWFKSEGFVFILLIVGCYSSLLGANIVLKEESDKTIEYLNGLPLKRNNIVLTKALVGVLYIICMVAVILVFNYICLYLSGDLDTKQYILLSITPLFSSLVLFFVSMFLSTFTHKSKKMIGVSLGLVLISYFFQVLSTLSESVEFFKYISVFTLSDIRNVIMEIAINPFMILVSLGLSFVFLIASLWRYNKKELV